jgi:hypothetical protein
MIKKEENTFCLPPAYLLVLAEIFSSTLKMEAIGSSETSVATQQTTRRHIPEDDTLHNHRSENLKSYKENSGFNDKVKITYLETLEWKNPVL